MFKYETTIKMHETDAAGVLFFAHQFKLVHDAYQAFLESKGWNFRKILEKETFSLPIVHARTDYKMPVYVGDKITIQLQLKKMGNSAFTISHEIYKSDNHLAGMGETIHVCIDKKTKKKVSIPNTFQETLKTLNDEIEIN